MSLKIEGIEQLNAALTNHEGRIEKETRDILRRAGARVRRKQRATVPKRTGTLMRSITMRSRGTRWVRVVEVGPQWSRTTKGQKVNTHYGFFIEFGTSRMAAQPFVAPSLDGEAEALARDLNEALHFK